jgi:hypothetical protein
MKKIRNHIEYGDPAGESGAEILPHPWCDVNLKIENLVL